MGWALPRFLKGILYDKNGNAIDSSNPVPVTSVSHIASNLEGGGKIEVGTTEVEVSFSGTTESIIITADIDNVGKLYIGKTGVGNDGSSAITFLEAGDSITLDYNDADNAIYIISDTASQYFWKGALL